MLIGIDSSLSLRNRSCSTTKCHQNKSDLKNVFVQKSFFSKSSILSIPIMLIGINGGYFPAICRVCSQFFPSFLKICHFLSFISPWCQGTSSSIGVLFVFFVSSDALFSFYIWSHLKAEKSKFLNDYFLSLTAFARVMSFLSLSPSKVFCVIRF